MPQAVGAAAIGLFSAGAGAAAGAAAAGTLAATMTAALGGALIGAAVGGLTAAVTGGSIGKGVLYGAVGGAVMGGLSGFTGIGSGGAGGAESMLDYTTVNSLEDVVASGASSTPGGTGSAWGEIGAGVSRGAKALGGVATDSLGGTLIEGGLGMIGSAMEGADAAEEAQDARNWQAEQAELNRQHEQNMSKLNASLRGGSSGGSDALGVARIQQQTAREQLAEQRRQYDTDLSNARDLRKTASNALAGVRAARKGVLKGGTESIDKQVAQEEKDLMYIFEPATGKMEPEKPAEAN